MNRMGKLRWHWATEGFDPIERHPPLGMQTQIGKSESGNLMTVCNHAHIDARPMAGFAPDRVDDSLNLNSIQIICIV